MNAGAWVDPRVEQVRVDDVCSYLLAHGWRLRPYPRPELLVFEGPPDDDGEMIVQVVPSSEQMRDYRMRVEELIAALSVLEDRPTREVLDELLRTAPAEGNRNGVGTRNSPPNAEKTRPDGRE